MRIVLALAALLAPAAVPPPPTATAASTSLDPAVAEAAEVSVRAAADNLRRLARDLGSAPRVAGTPGAARAARLIADRMRSWGLDVQVHEYDVWLPHARTVRVERLGATTIAVAGSVAAGPRIAHGESSGPVSVAAGYSAAGDVTGPVVYANYGRRQDFAALERAGIEVRGSVALIRYGGLFRGDKVHNAEQAGAAAVILYSDPEDDGFVRGAVYPDGPFRPAQSVQRGSVKIGAPGDPASPGVPALVGRPRSVPHAGLPRVPVVALGYGAAGQILAAMQGPPAPRAWSGGLPLPYRLGGHGDPVRVLVEFDDQPWRRLRNVVGTLAGARHPDEWIILGAHYDSWSYGAVDNVSGTVAMLEAARVLAAQAAAGHRPDRSLLFAAWDAEEWGLVGSTEWVEQFAAPLRERGVAYVNLDGVAGGPFFSGVASPSLRALLQAGADAVVDPVLPRTSVYRAWQGRTPGARFGLPAGASDYAAFASIAGVPSIGFGFGGAAGVYHSDNDTIEFLERYGDPGYRQHRAVASLATWLMWRLGNDRSVGFDYRPLAQDVVAGLSAVRRHLASAGYANGVPGLARAWAGAGALAEAAGRLRQQQRSAQGMKVAPAGFDAANRHMRRAHRRLTAAAAGPFWGRSLLVAPDPRDTYRSLLLPQVLEPLRRADITATVTALRGLGASLEAAAAELRAADRALRPARRATAVASN